MRRMLGWLILVLVVGAGLWWGLDRFGDRPATVPQAGAPATTTPATGTVAGSADSAADAAADAAAIAADAAAEASANANAAEGNPAILQAALDQVRAVLR